MPKTKQANTAKDFTAIHNLAQQGMADFVLAGGSMNR